jgi:hypothetical protein
MDSPVQESLTEESKKNVKGNAQRMDSPVLNEGHSSIPLPLLLSLAKETREFFL